MTKDLREKEEVIARRISILSDSVALMSIVVSAVVGLICWGLTASVPVSEKSQSAEFSQSDNQDQSDSSINSTDEIIMSSNSNLARMSENDSNEEPKIGLLLEGIIRFLKKSGDLDGNTFPTSHEDPKLVRAIEKYRAREYPDIVSAESNVKMDTISSPRVVKQPGGGILILYNRD